MKKYKTIPLNYEISIDNETEETSAKEILRQEGGCSFVSCGTCPFHHDDYDINCFNKKERVRIIKQMGVEL